MGAPKRSFRTRLQAIFKVGNMTKGQVLQLPPSTRRSHGKTTDARRDRWEHQNEHFVRDFLQFFTLCSCKIDVFLKICNPKIDVSCEASVNFQHMSENATPATEFALCHHLTQPCQRDLQKTRNRARLKCCACHEK